MEKVLQVSWKIWSKIQFDILGLTLTTVTDRVFTYVYVGNLTKMLSSEKQFPTLLYLTTLHYTLFTVGILWFHLYNRCHPWLPTWPYLALLWYTWCTVVHFGHRVDIWLSVAFYVDHRGQPFFFTVSKVHTRNYKYCKGKSSVYTLHHGRRHGKIYFCFLHGDFLSKSRHFFGHGKKCCEIFK